jgi:FkbM family methyltransferase
MMNLLYDVVFYDTVGSGYGSMGAMGGSELAVTRLAQALAAKGHKVAVVADHEAEGPVTYVRVSSEIESIQARALIIQRYSARPKAFACTELLIWAHDAEETVYRHHAELLARGSATLVCVSAWQAAQFPRAWKKTVFSPMLEDEAYAEPNPLRDRTRFLFASSTVKGLDATLAAWRRLATPNLTLEVTAPYGEADPGKLAAAGAVWLGRLSPAEVRDRLSRVAGLFYVNTFPETFCNLAALAEAAGARCHILTLADPGGLPEAIRSPLLMSDRAQFDRQFKQALESRDPFSRDFVAIPHDRRVVTILPAWEKLLFGSAAAPSVEALPAAPAGLRPERSSPVCLSMIVKDSAQTIERAVQSALPHIGSYAILLDARSVDGTAEILQRCLKGLPGVVKRTRKTDLALLRNLALAEAGKLADYALILDADDWFEADPWLHLDLTRDAYEVLVEDTGVTYWRTHLVRTRAGFAYQGAAHEVLISPSHATTARLHALRYRRTTSSSTPKKLLADASALKKTASSNPRSAFYLAQSLRDAGKPVQALRAYKARFAMGGWDEERFYSACEVARMHFARGRPASGEKWYLRAADVFPARATEALSLAAWQCRLQQQWPRAYRHALAAVTMNRGPAGTLFVDRSHYDWRAENELAVAAFYLGRKDEARAHYEALLGPLSKLPMSERAQVEAGLAWTVAGEDRAGEDRAGEDRFPAAPPPPTQSPDGRLFFFPDAPPHTKATCELIARLVFAGEYDAPELPTQASAVLDIGAHIGSFSAWARAKWPGAHQACYEPNPPAADLCRRNVPEAFVTCAAITTARSPELFVHEDWGMNYTRASVEDEGVDAWRKSQPRQGGMPVVAIHPKTLPACDVLKIDAEGVEPEILAAYPHLADVRACLYEYHSVAHRDACRAACTRAGLRHVKHSVYNENQGIDIFVR